MASTSGQARENSFFIWDCGQLLLDFIELTWQLVEDVYSSTLLQGMIIRDVPLSTQSAKSAYISLIAFIYFLIFNINTYKGQ